MENVTSKKQFHRLWHDGTFGNKAGDWRTYGELEESGFKGTVAIRYCGIGHGSLFIKDLKVEQVKAELNKAYSQGWSLNDLYILEQISPSQVRYLVNMEVIRTELGLAVFYSRVNDLMRDSLRAGGQQIFGLRAEMLLKYLLTPVDYDELMYLLDRFPDHAIEVSGFDRSVGTMSNHRMIVWEVRKY